ncbi:MAG: LytTR family DNA-binding domain-containing protein [Bacteroidales bacterium]|nr:LytTR family DNA-binding domain-containing protein [Bacteroidales bacterium]
MTNTVIIDDELKSIELVSDFLKEFCSAVNIAGTASNAKTGLEEINTKNPDLVILDVEMPDMDGFQLLKCLPDINFDIIFISAYNDYAVKAFKVCAVDYLLKPINPEELVKAINKVQEKRKTKKYTDISYRKLFETFEKQQTQKIIIPTKEKNHFIKVDDIIHVEAQGNYSMIFLSEDNSMLISKSIKEFEEYLCSPLFFRIHKSYLINLEYVKNFSYKDGGTIEMESGKKLSVSRRKKEAFRDKMDEFLNKLI